MNNKDVQPWVTEARRVADNVRRRVLEHSIKNNGGYLSQACSAAETLATLYVKIMRLGPGVAPKRPLPFPGVPSATNTSYFTGAAYNGAGGPSHDRFFLSPAHYALVLYALLIETGRMDEQALDQFNQDGSTVEMIGAEHSPGMEVTGGALGQTLSQVAGIALGRRLKKEAGMNWVYMSDGEFQEGQTWETFQFLAHHKLDNVIVYIDVNGQQCDGRMSDVMEIEPLRQRLEAFGATVETVMDGHDVEALAAAIHRKQRGKTLVVPVYTDPAHGVELLRNRAPRLHYLRFTSEGERESYRTFLKERWGKR